MQPELFAYPPQPSARHRRMLLTTERRSFSRGDGAGVSLPLDCGRRFGGDVVRDAVDALNVPNYAVGHVR